MKQMLNEIKEEVKEIKESQKELDHDGGRRLSTRLQRRSPWLLDVDLESNRSEEVPAKPAEALEAKATNATAAAQGLTSLQITRGSMEAWQRIRIFPQAVSTLGMWPDC